MAKKKTERRVRSFSIDGLFCERDCKALQMALNGKSYYNFKVFYGSWAGNCVLNIETDYPHGTIAEAKRFFVWLAFVTLAELARPLLDEKNNITK